MCVCVCLLHLFWVLSQDQVISPSLDIEHSLTWAPSHTLSSIIIIKWKKSGERDKERERDTHTQRHREWETERERQRQGGEREEEHR